jgi:hypothetical protein
MKCPRCGNENAEDARFCSFCGADLSVAPSEPGPQVTPPAGWQPMPETTGPQRLPSGAAVRDFGSRGWNVALPWGVIAFVVMVAIGQALAFAVTSTADAPPSTGSTVKIGALYFYAFHHVGIVAEAPRIDLPPELASELPISGGSLKFGIALMLMTALVAFIHYRAGRAVAAREEGGPLALGLHGLKAAIPYAILSLVLSFLISFRFDLPEPVAGGELTIKPSVLGAVLWPLGIGGIAAFLGGFLSPRAGLAGRGAWGRWAAGALAGGGRMFGYALVLAFAGLLVLAALKPQDTRDYFDGVAEAGARDGTILVSHHVLLLPNQSMWVLVPAMGRCDTASFSAVGVGASADFLCYGRFPRSVEAGPALSGDGTVREAAQPPEADFGTAPGGYFLFLLVPLVSTLMGGMVAARRSSAESRGQAAAAGALAGVVYGALVTAGAVLANITVTISGSVGELTGGARAAVGPEVGMGTLIGLVWGIGGGALGALYHARQLPRTGQAVTGPAGPEPPATLSSP